MTEQGFKIVFEAEAEVIRGCCGREHEAGPCPYATDQTDEGSEAS